MELAIRLGGEAETARLDAREVRKLNAMRNDRVIFGIPRWVFVNIGFFNVGFPGRLEVRAMLYSIDGYRQCAFGMWLLSLSYSSSSAEASCGYIVALWIGDATRDPIR